MTRCFAGLCVGIAILMTQHSHGDVPATSARTGNLVGNWRVEFSNDVVEACNFFEFDGLRAMVDEPQRKSRGDVVTEDGRFLVTYHDDRVERWTPVGSRFVVEHWYPASRLPTSTPVLGIAERAQ